VAKDLAPPGKLANLVPMPPIGWPVQWFERGVKKAAFPAQVLQHNQDPGYVKLVYHHGTATRQIQNATYAPLVEGKPASQTVLNYGTWDYLPGMEIPECHKDFHLNRLKDLERAASQRVANEKAARESYEASLKQQPDVMGAAVQRAAMMAAQVTQQGS